MRRCGDRSEPTNTQREIIIYKPSRHKEPQQPALFASFAPTRHNSTRKSYKAA
jgi:hypothetical protein